MEVWELKQKFENEFRKIIDSGVMELATAMSEMEKIGNVSDVRKLIDIAIEVVQEKFGDLYPEG